MLAIEPNLQDKGGFQPLQAVNESYLFESLQQTPEDAMCDSINTSADDVYSEIYGS